MRVLNQPNRAGESRNFEFQEVSSVSNQRTGTLLLFLLVITIIEFFGVLQPLRRLGEWILQPLTKTARQVVYLVELPYFVIRQNYRNYTYIQDIELRYAEAVAQLGELDTLKKENQELRQLIEKPVASDQKKPVIAPILSYSQPYIGKGLRDGVQIHDLVMISQTFIGLVTKASESQSVLTLLTATDSLPILVRTESGITGVAAGNGGQLLMKEVPQDANLQVGERVLTIGQAEVPAGLSLGRIQSISRSAISSAQVAVIDQGVSFYESHIVEVRQP